MYEAVLSRGIMSIEREEMIKRLSITVGVTLNAAGGKYGKLMGDCRGFG